MMVYREIGYGEPGPPVLRGHLEFRAWDGTPLLIETIEDPPRDSYYYATLGGIGMGRAFFHTNTWAVFPTTYEFVIDE